MRTAEVTNLSERALADNVDRLGNINAQIAELEAKAKAIKAKLVASGQPEIIGKNYRAVISERERTTLDSALVRSILSPAQIIACTKVSTSTAVCLYDR
jgi:hypothetical protein